MLNFILKFLSYELINFININSIDFNVYTLKEIKFLYFKALKF